MRLTSNYYVTTYAPVCHLSHRATVPLDGPYLSNSPFMLNVGHSFAGFYTIGLQCTVPSGGWSFTPQEVAGAHSL